MSYGLSVKVGQQFKDYWSAILVVDGEETTFSCHHNHKTEGAARKCCDAVMASARMFTWHKSFQATFIDTTDWGINDDRPLIEWTRESDRGKVSVRFRLGAENQW